MSALFVISLFAICLARTPKKAYVLANSPAPSGSIVEQTASLAGKVEQALQVLRRDTNLLQSIESDLTSRETFVLVKVPARAIRDLLSTAPISQAEAPKTYELVELGILDEHLEPLAEVPAPDFSAFFSPAVLQLIDRQLNRNVLTETLAESQSHSQSQSQSQQRSQSRVSQQSISQRKRSGVSGKQRQEQQQQRSEEGAEIFPFDRLPFTQRLLPKWALHPNRTKGERDIPSPSAYFNKLAAGFAASATGGAAGGAAPAKAP